MSKPITSKRFIELCDKWGVKWSPIQSSWATHNRNHKGPFEDVNGILMHHTGKFSTVAGMNNILWNGYAGLPGPLCHSGIDPAGILRLAGWGRANHAGMGDSAILRRVKQSDLPRTSSLRPAKADVDGNAHLYGFEIMCDGIEPMSEAQRITAVRVAAMLCTEHEWKADVIGHGEWQPGKWDPGAHGKLINMGEFRSWVDQAMKEGPKPKLPSRPKPPTTKPKTKEITVAKGDTLYSLAQKYFPHAESSDEAIVDLVTMNPQLLQVGEKLTVPNI